MEGALLQMKYLELASIVCFLLAGAAGNSDECIGYAFILVSFAGICAVLAAELPHHKRKKVRRK